MHTHGVHGSHVTCCICFFAAVGNRHCSTQLHAHFDLTVHRELLLSSSKHSASAGDTPPTALRQVPLDGVRTVPFGGHHVKFPSKRASNAHQRFSTQESHEARHATRVGTDANQCYLCHSTFSAVFDAQNHLKRSIQRGQCTDDQSVTSQVVTVATSLPGPIDDYQRSYTQFQQVTRHIAENHISSLLRSSLDEHFFFCSFTLHMASWRIDLAAALRPSVRSFLKRRQKSLGPGIQQARKTRENPRDHIRRHHRRARGRRHQRARPEHIHTDGQPFQLYRRFRALQGATYRIIHVTRDNLVITTLVQTGTTNAQTVADSTEPEAIPPPDLYLGADSSGWWQRS